jgi:hypothetical protein
MQPTTERRALDRLLALFPSFDLLEVNWYRASGTTDGGPWLRVRLGQRSDDGYESWAVHHFAIWKVTGAVHGIDADGAVIDPPLIPGDVGAG